MRKWYEKATTILSGGKRDTEAGVRAEKARIKYEKKLIEHGIFEQCCSFYGSLDSLKCACTRDVDIRR